MQNDKNSIVSKKEETQKKIDKRKNKKNTKKIKNKIFLATSVFMASTFVIGGYYGWKKFSPTIYSYVNNGYDIARTINSQSLNYDRTTVIKDSSGNVIKELNSISKLKTNFNDINPLLKNGFVAVEDERFYKHHGVDLWATIRAIFTKLKGGSLQGGSTLTQQLVKNKILKDFEQTSKRKVTEMVVAQEIENKFSKKQILESYLNNVYFGHGAYGVNAAAKAYFNKDQKDLTIRESAIVISLTNNPTLYDPSINPKTSDKKVKEVLGKMYVNNVINKKQYKQALKEKTVLNLTKLFNENDYTDNYALSFAINRAAEELAKIDGFNFIYKFNTDEEYKNYQKLKSEIMQQEIDKLIGGGYEIQTTIDMNLQNQIENSVYEQMAGFTDINPETGKLDLQTSVTIIDNNTNNVVAVVGGRGTDGDYLNRSWNGYRQPGSTAKPIIAYAPAFDAGTLSPNSMLLDAQVPQFPGVGNADGVYRNANISVRQAVNMSLNTPAIRASLGTDMNVVTDDLAKMQFGRLHPYDLNNIIAIGGFTYGTTTTEMAGAYSSFTNEGNYVEPTNVEQIKNVNTGEVFYQNPRTKVKVYSKESSYAMLDILKTAATGYTTYYQQAVADNYPKELQAGKSGTTDAFRDSYWVGVTSYYTTAVWVGRESNESLSQTEQNQAKAINRIISNIVLSGKEPKDFVKPETVIKNGDSITFTSKENVSKESKKNKEKYSKLEKSNRELTNKENKDRLFENNYRIVYGLSKSDEETLELDAENMINSININDFKEKSQYEDFQTKLTSARLAISKVKRPSKQKELTDSLTKMQTEISEKYASILDAEKSAENYENQTKINQAEKKSENERYKLISKEEALLSEQIETVKKSPTKSNVDELDNIIYELNRLGKNHPYYEIVVKDGEFVSMNEKE